MKFKVFAVILPLFTLIPAFSQEIVTAERYLETVADRYGQIRDYEAQINIRSGSTEMSGNLSYLYPSYLRIDFARPANQVIVFNGELLTVYLPAPYSAVLNQAVTPTRRGAVPNAQGILLLRRNYVSSFVTGPSPVPLEGSGESVVKLRLARRTVSEGFREIILSINPNTRMIRRIEGVTIAGGQVQFDFYNVRTNQGIPEMRFVYDSPGSANMYNNFLFRDVD